MNAAARNILFRRHGKNQITSDYISCGRKQRHKSFKRAKDICDEINKGRPKNKHLKPYKCDVCDGWHKATVRGVK